MIRRPPRSTRTYPLVPDTTLVRSGFTLWTDATLRALVAERFPELLPAFDGYAAPISRADLGRYLVLAAFGGVYADLDCECLAPIAPLLDGAELAIGLEPDSPLRLHEAARRGLTRSEGRRVGKGWGRTV